MPSFSLANGQPLPTWLCYDAEGQRFEVSAPPAGALPLDLRVLIEERRWTLRISEKGE